MTFTSGLITKAVYTTSAGTREVDYTEGATPTVTYYPGTSDQRHIYVLLQRASELSVITQKNWPQSGTT